VDEVDVVYTWVDGVNSNFQAEMSARLRDLPEPPPPSSLRLGIFRDHGELRYSLRSLEKFAPWVRRIYIVTDGQRPCWLRESNNRISVITHDQIFTRKSDLPTFNSNAIEAHLHRIPGLSRRFLYFNDDVVLGRPVSIGDFVTPAGGQYVYVDHALLTKIPEQWVDDRMQAHTRMLIQKMCGRSISRLMPAHVPHFFDRDILFSLQKTFVEEFRETSSSPFRSSNDISTPTLYSLYVSEVLGHKSGYERRFLTPLALHGLHDYAMVMLTNRVWEMLAFLWAVRAFRPRFISVNDRTGMTFFSNLSLLCFRGFLHSYFPCRSSFE